MFEVGQRVRIVRQPSFGVPIGTEGIVRSVKVHNAVTIYEVLPDEPNHFCDPTLPYLTDELETI